MARKFVINKYLKNVKVFIRSIGFAVFKEEETNL